MSRSERRREQREGSSDMKKLYLVLAAVGVVVVAAVGYSFNSGGGGDAVVAPVAVEGLDNLERLVELAQGETKGDEGAPLTIIEFGDYQCPACQQFATQVKSQLELTYIESGKAKLVFYDWPIVGGHPNAFLAARAARCAADQGLFWEYHDNLFRYQARWAPLPNPTDTFAEYAETLGLDRRSFTDCLNSDRHAELVTANMELGNQLGVNGTPTIFVEKGGSARRAPMDFPSLSSYLEVLLTESEEGA